MQLQNNNHGYLSIGNEVGTDRLNNKSRMNREVHVRFCEGLGVKFPRPTRPYWQAKEINRVILECDPIGMHLFTKQETGDLKIGAILGTHDPNGPW